MGDSRYVRQIANHYLKRDEVVSHVMPVLDHYTTLHPEQNDFNYDDGRVELLLSLTGVIPVSLRGTTYNCPLAVWLPLDYPTKPPMVLIVPTSTMQIKAGKHVDRNGNVSVPYMDDWGKKGEGCSLMPLMEILTGLFSREYPLVSISAAPPKPKPPPPQPAPVPQPPGSQSRGSPAPGPPPPRPAPPNDQRHLRSDSAGSDGRAPPQRPPIPSQYHYGPPGYAPSPPIPASQSSPAPPPIPPQPQQRQQTFAPPRPPLPGGQSPSPHPTQPFRPPANEEPYARANSASPAPLPPRPPNGYAYPAPQPPQHFVPAQQYSHHHSHSSSNPLPPPVPPAHNVPVAPPVQHYTSPPPSTQPGRPVSASYDSRAYGYQQAPQHHQYAPATGLQTTTYTPPPLSPASTEGAMPPSIPPISQTAPPRQPQQQPRNELPPPPQRAKTLAVNILDGPDELASPSSAYAPNSQSGAPPPRPPNPELLALRTRIHSKLSHSLSLLHSRTEHDLSQLALLRSDLEKGEPAVIDEMQRLEAVRSVCEVVGERYRGVVAEAERRVGEYEMRGDGPEVDEIVCSSTIVYNQLLELVAEDAALEDTIYHLGRGLNSETAKIDLDVFLKRTRALAREQFMKRALINKILLGLASRQQASSARSTS